MITLQPHEIMIAAGIATLFAAMMYLLGYDAGIDASRAYAKRERERARADRAQKNKLATWVQSQWPTELAAFEMGANQGYAQGLIHSEEMRDDE